MKTLHDHEVFADQERLAIAGLVEDLAPIHLPTPEEVERVVVDFDDHLKRDPETAREQMKRWIQGGTIRVGPREDGAIIAEGTLLPLMVINDGQSPKRHLPVINSMITGRYTRVAGARFDVLTTRNQSGSSSETRYEPALDDADFAFLDYLVAKAIETFFPPTTPVRQPNTD